MAFVKLHSTILNSSIWLEDAPTRIVWITLLALADESGVVRASVGGLAHTARVTRKECEDALQCFLSPDDDTRDGTTGERLEKVPGGWFVLNHSQYRDKRTMAQILTAERVRRHRSRINSVTGVTRNDVTLRNATSPSEAEAEEEILDLPLPNSLQKKILIQEEALVRSGAPDHFPHQEIISLYHEILANHPKVRVWHSARHKALRARWREHPSLKWWRGYFEDVAQSKFLSGKVDSASGRPPFVADLEWLIKLSNMTKVYEGKYDV